MRLPKKLNLGCGNIILIKEVQRSVIQAAAGVDVEAFWSVDAPDAASHCGVIMLDQSLPLGRKKYVLYHELAHAVNDVMYWERDKI